MNDQPTMREAGKDDWLDAALRAEGVEHRADYLADDGFTARVMAELPVPETLPAWRTPVLIVLWVCAGIGVAFALPGLLADAPSLPGLLSDAARETVRLVSGHPVSLTGIAVGILALAAANWTAAAFALAKD